MHRRLSGHSPVRKYPDRNTVRTNGLIRLTQGEVIINQQPLPDPKARLASIATDGVYIVRGINYRGDTRGQEWYMDMVCEARGADDLKTQEAFNR